MELAGNLTCILSLLNIMACDVWIWWLPSDGCYLLFRVHNNVRNGISSGFVMKVVYLLPEVAIFHLTA